MKPNIIKYTIAALTILISLNALSQSSSNVLTRPLKRINYMSVNGRFGLGLGTPKMNISNEWSVDPGLIQNFSAGYNFVIKNNWGFDLQINHERGSFKVSYPGPTFNTSYNTTGIEVGVKKFFPTKPDDTFFFRGSFGYNFLVNVGEINTSDFYYCSISNSGNSIYALPEFGYQFRFPSGKHIIDLSVGYQFSFVNIKNVNVVYTDGSNDVSTHVSNNFDFNGRYFSARLRYSFLFKGFEDVETTTKKVDSHF